MRIKESGLNQKNDSVPIVFLEALDGLDYLDGLETLDSLDQADYKNFTTSSSGRLSGRFGSCAR